MDSATRWNSTLRMIRRLREVRGAYEATVTLLAKLQQFSLTDYEWRKLDVLIEALLPFEEATFIMSQCNSVTISDTEVVYQYLFEHSERI